MLVSGSLPPMRCGVGDYTDVLANTLAVMPQNNVGVLTSDRAREGHGRGNDRYERLPVMEDWSLSDAAVARRAIQAWKPDIVHVQYPTQGYGSMSLPSVLPLLAWQLGALPVRTWHEAFSGRQAAGFLLQIAAPGPFIVVRPNFADLMWPPLRPLLSNRGVMIAGASSIPRASLTVDERNALRERYLRGQSRLIVFFGFIYPAKGVHQLFEIADPVMDAIVIVGESHDDPHYFSKIKTLATSDPWAACTTMAGFVATDAIANLLMAADVVVLPFVEGGGNWNSSISAAVLQGTPVVTTSVACHGIDDTGQIYFARPNDIEDLRYGLQLVDADRAISSREQPARNDWLRIGDHHMAVYEKALSVRPSRAAQRADVTK